MLNRITRAASYHLAVFRGRFAIAKAERSTATTVAAPEPTARFQVAHRERPQRGGGTYLAVGVLDVSLDRFLQTGGRGTYSDAHARELAAAFNEGQWSPEEAVWTWEAAE